MYKKQCIKKLCQEIYSFCQEIYLFCQNNKYYITFKQFI